MVSPNASTSDFCDFLLGYRFIKLTAPQIVLVNVIQTASQSAGTVSDQEWSDFLMISGQWYQFYTAEIAMTQSNHYFLDYHMWVSGTSVTTTSTSAQNITGLVTPTLLVNRQYCFQGYLNTECSGTGGIKYALDVPTGATLILWALGASTSATAFAQRGTAVDNGLTSVAQNAEVSIRGVWVSAGVLMGSTAGACQFKFASGTNGQTSTIYRNGSLIKMSLMPA